MDKLGSGYQPIAAWISNEKFLHSHRLGYDVGVPATVDNLIARAYSLRELGFVPSDSPSKQMDDILLTDAKRDGIASRETWISTYFFNSVINEFTDSQGANPLEGELKRFAARKHGMPVEQVVLTTQIVREYAEVHKLPKNFQNFACSKLELLEMFKSTPA
jgi:hypothetical protein